MIIASVCIGVEPVGCSVCGRARPVGFAGCARDGCPYRVKVQESDN